MRLALRLLCLAGLLPALAVGVSAFDFSDGGARAVSVTISGDAAAYLSVAERDGPNDCFVTESGASGKISISFASAAGCDAAGAGTGINAAVGNGAGNFTTYAFHDLLLVTNKGTRAIAFWANATSTSGTLDVAKAGTLGTMTGASYAASSATPLSIAVGSTAYVGVRVNTTTLQSGSVSGSVDLVARGTG
jgi:hypothetical protein